jgi:hypothetical protein
VLDAGDLGLTSRNSDLSYAAMRGQKADQTQVNLSVERILKHKM